MFHHTECLKTQYVFPSSFLTIKGFSYHTDHCKNQSSKSYYSKESEESSVIGETVNNPIREPIRRSY